MKRLCIYCIFIVSACCMDPVETRPDGRPGVDGSVLVDSGVDLDGSVALDSSLGMDGSVADGPIIDGSILDSSTPDSSIPDSSMTDGSILDGSLPDSSVDGAVPQERFCGWYGSDLELQPYMPVLPITESLDSILPEIEDRLQEARDQSIKIIFRPRYNNDSSGTDADLPTILSHINQLSLAMSEYEDVILVLQLGFVGAWGEFHSSSHPENETPEARNQIIQASLDSFTGLVAVRRPHWHRDFLLENNTSRLTVFDDCIGCSSTDGGSWPSGNEAFWRNYIGELPATGGEISQMSSTPDNLKGYDNTRRIAEQMNLCYVNEGWNKAVWEDWTEEEMEAFTYSLESGW